LVIPLTPSWLPCCFGLSEPEYNPNERTEGKPLKTKSRKELVVIAAGLSVVTIIIAATYFFNSLTANVERLSEIPVKRLDEFRLFAKKLANDVNDVIHVTPQISINSNVVVDRSENILELATVATELTATSEYRNEHFLSEKVLRIEGEFRAKAGFDLRNTNAFCFRINSAAGVTNVMVVLPEPEILSIELLSNRILQQDNGLWNSLTAADQKVAMDQLLKTAKVIAAKTMPAQAKENLEAQLKRIALSNGTTMQLQYIPKFTRRQIAENKGR
jgi:hypothetical protein